MCIYRTILISLIRVHLQHSPIILPMSTNTPHMRITDRVASTALQNLIIRSCFMVDVLSFLPSPLSFRFSHYSTRLPLPDLCIERQQAAAAATFLIPSYPIIMEKMNRNLISALTGAEKLIKMPWLETDERKNINWGLAADVAVIGDVWCLGFNDK